MYEFNFIILLLTIVLSSIQTIAGVGILVLGTPILILFGFSMFEVMLFLLPLSIFNSLINILYLKVKKKIKIDKKMNKYFFFICFPSVLVGLFFLKQFDKYINFNLLISFAIWIILILSYLHKAKNFSKNLKKIIIFFTGLLHGVTNSGGSLLTILIVKSKDKNPIFKRYQIIYFYFLLATFQLLSLVFIFEVNYLKNFNYLNLFCVALGVLIGNLIAYKINDDQLKIIVKVLAFFTSIVLLSKS